ncbi:MAG: class I SAM-dependent methyltransferase, partial [Caulobacterales bacterium]
MGAAAALDWPSTPGGADTRACSGCPRKANRLAHSALPNRRVGMSANSKGYSRIEQCRIGGGSHLISVLNLGLQELTGVFPKSADQPVASGPIELVWAPKSGLVQLAHSFEPSEMYGDNYGYRSGLNQSMVRHLTHKIQYLERMYDVKPGDSILDIGSNDATSLKAYETSGLKRVGIDPTGSKFRQFYPDDIKLVPDFFNAKNYWSVMDGPAKIVTSIAMFYDLEDPIAFARDIAAVLANDGVWHFEQSYLPAMLRTNSYDTMCHEHLEYYSLGVVKLILDAADLQLIDVQMNGINGGSFAVTAAKKGASVKPNTPLIEWLLEQEERMGLNTARPYREFEDRVYRHRGDLRRLVDGLNAEGKKVFGLGASTKG